MKLFIFNDSTGKQRVDFYESELSEDVLWKGESVEAFEAETGFTLAQLGGFKLDSRKKLKFDQALKDAFDNPPPPPKTLNEKRLELVAIFKTLPLNTRVLFQATAVTVDTALQLGDVELAIANLEYAQTTTGADTVLLQNMIDLINS